MAPPNPLAAAAPAIIRPRNPRRLMPTAPSSPPSRSGLEAMNSLIRSWNPGVFRSPGPMSGLTSEKAAPRALCFALLPAGSATPSVAWSISPARSGVMSWKPPMCLSPAAIALRSERGSGFLPGGVHVIAPSSLPSIRIASLTVPGRSRPNFLPILTMVLSNGLPLPSPAPQSHANSARAVCGSRPMVSMSLRPRYFTSARFSASLSGPATTSGW